MWYAIVGEDAPESLPMRARGREAHLARVQALVEDGRLLVAGPHPAIDAEDPGPAGFTGSLVIAEFESLEDAEHWANADPYLQTGAWTKVTVRPFNRVLP